MRIVTEKKAPAQLSNDKHTLVNLHCRSYSLKRISGNSQKIGFKKITYLLLMEELSSGQNRWDFLIL